MKKLLLVCALFFVGCSDPVSPIIYNHDLIGKWEVHLPFFYNVTFYIDGTLIQELTSGNDTMTWSADYHKLTYGNSILNYEINVVNDSLELHWWKDDVSGHEIRVYRLK